jgi:hypothetical protein
MDEIIDKELDVSLEYNSLCKYYIRDSKKNRKGEDLYELVDCKKPYYFNIARIKPFVLAKSREMVGKVANKYIDDVIRIHTDNVTFKAKHDDVICQSKTFKLTKEEKTTGLIEFRRVDCYKNYTNEKYTTKNFSKDSAIESDNDSVID